MIDGGETECAVDELRWLLEECRDFIAAHLVAFKGWVLRMK